MAPRVTVGVSLKMYFGHRQAIDWCRSVRALAETHPAVADGSVGLFVIPSFVAIAPAVAELAGSPVLVGAQDLYSEDRGAYTGEVSGAELAEAGARVVEVGHAERRRLFGETEEVVAAKTAAALRNGLTPVLCIGEAANTGAGEAVTECVRQLSSALADAPPGPVIVAYEPVWAIGAERPAEPEYIRAVTSELRLAVDELEGRDGSAVIYGGSAGPGLLTALGDDVDGLFLGRFAHDPAALAAVLDEAAALAAARSGRAATVEGRR
jgi:triosephosphate isomerase